MTASAVARRLAALATKAVAHTDLVVRVIDPDTYRTVGWEDDPNHFLDFGVKEYGAYPFADLPREWGAALEKFGMTTMRKNGLLPWRFQEEFGNLRRAFEGFTRASPFAPTDVVLFGPDRNFADMQNYLRWEEALGRKYGPATPGR